MVVEAVHIILLVIMGKVETVEELLVAMVLVNILLVVIMVLVALKQPQDMLKVLLQIV